MTFLSSELATRLERSIVSGYDPIKVSKVAFLLYHDHVLELTPSMKDILLTLMVMEEGPEFELSEAEFWDIIAEVRAM